MPLAIEVSLLRNGAPEAIQRLVAGIKPEALQPIVGRSATNTIRSHLFEQNTTRANRLGGPRTNFYTQAGRGTSFKVAGDHVVVSIASVGIAQRFFGGTIKPVNSKYLTIPARAEAYGKRASEFKDLEILFGRNGPYALARRAATLINFRRPNSKGLRTVGRAGQQGGEVMFWLVKEVTQRADPTVLPTEEKIQENLQRDVSSYVQRLIDRSSGPAPAGGAN